MESPAASRPVAELVVLNGRQKGSRCPLGSPLTLLGRDPSCNVQLNLDEIEPFHVAIVEGPVGPIVRDLSGEDGLIVNGQPVNNRLLHDGDVLTLGPFQFELSLPAGVAALPPLHPNVEGLRIQAAAVAAEQVRLTELEIRLEQRRMSLETQEKQLAVHLDEKHAKLEVLQQQVRDERSEWRQQREREEAELAQVRTDLALQRDQLDQERRNHREQERRERDRLAQERKALEDARLALDRQLDKDRQTLQAELVKAREERQNNEQIRLRLNTEMELGKRKLRDQREQLALEQQRWQATLEAEHQERKRWLDEVAAHQAEMEQQQFELASDKYEWRKAQIFAQKELAGLENRIRSTRARLSALEQELNRKEARLRGNATVVDLPALSYPSSAPVLAEAPAPAELRDLAAYLTDQRLHLAEQWQRLVTQQDTWENERAEVLAHLDATTTHLIQREADANRRAEALARQEAAIGQRELRLEALELRVRLQEQEYAQTQERLLAELTRRETECNETQTQAELRVQAERRRVRKAVRRLARARQGLEELHAQYAVLWQSQQEERRKLVPSQQEIARQRLALEKMRHEVLARAVNVTIAERKLDRLEKEVAAVWAKAEADLKAEWQSLDRERTTLNQLAQQGLVRVAEGIQKVRQTVQSSNQRRDRAQERARARKERQAQWQRLVAERDRAERRADQLQGELDRLALNLMGVESPAPPVEPETRAA